MENAAKVTVLLPVYNSEKYIAQCLDSIQAQTFTHWDMLILNEFGSHKACTKILRSYARRDPRIQVVQNTTKLGLAESLNAGMRMARGEYIARMDADDLAHPERFEKEVAYMEAHPNTAVLGSYQHHFGAEIDWIHKPPTDQEQCKANMLFFCDLCHSTLMLRKKTFLENNLFYDNHFMAEDFELWSRVISHGDIVNLPQVLGEYRVGEDNITAAKKDRLHLESGMLVARTLKRTLDLELDPKQYYLFNNWRNDFAGIKDREKRAAAYEELKETLIQIYEANQAVKFFEERALLRAIRAKWAWAYAGEPFNRMVDVVNNDINSIFKMKYSNLTLNRFYYFWKDNKGFLKKVKKVVKKTKELFEHGEES